MVKKAKVTETTRIAKFGLFFYRHFRLGITVWLALFLFGFFTYTSLFQRQGFPQVSVPIGIVQAIYFADDKAKVDSHVTTPLLEIISKQDYVASSRANSSDNATTIVLEYTDDTTSEQGTKDIEAAIKSANPELPETAQIVYQSIDAGRLNNKYDVILAVSSPSADMSRLFEEAEAVAASLKSQLPEVQVIEAVNPYREAKNPFTGKTERQQVQFDWYGSRSQSSDLDILPSVTIGIRLNDNVDILAFDTKLQDKIQQANEAQGSNDVRVAQAAGFAPSIRQQINSLQKNLFEGLLIVILVSCIFIGLRSSLVAAFGMLMTLTITVGILYLTGNTLNTITLFGLVLCLGLIVDDIVIINEAIDSQRKRTKTLPEAIARAIKKVALASTAGTLTTILGFAPLLFFGGILGEFIRVLPITIIISLLVSLLVSVAFVPFITRWLLPEKSNSKPGVQSKNPFAMFRQLISWLAQRAANSMRGASSIKQKAVKTSIAVAISLVFIAATGPLFQKLKFDIFPAAKDSDTLQVEYDFVPGLTLKEAEKITASGNDTLKKVIGNDLVQITYQGNGGTNQAVAEVTLVNFEERERTAPAIAEQLNASFSSFKQVVVTVNQVSAGPPKERLPFKVQIESEDTAQADFVGTKLAAFLQDREVKRSNGTIARTSEVSYDGEKAVITRTDGKRIVEVAAGYDADDTSALVQATQKDIEENFLSNDSNLNGLSKESVKFDFGVESDNQDSFKTVLFALPILFLLMYLLLVFQFRSLVQPILILVAVPFSFFGVAMALLLTENPFSFFVMVGFFALIGISVNNTILLTDYANQARRRGESPRYAMAEAIEERTRPLLTTSVTSVLALLPLALTDPFWESLAFTLIGGLLASTLLVIVSFPYYYLLLEFVRSRMIQRFAKYRQNLKKRKK